MKELLFAAIMPHPPIIVPEVGKKRLKEAAQSKKAAEEVSRRIKKVDCETVIIITPHGEVGQASVPVYTSHVFEGSFTSSCIFPSRGTPNLESAITATSPEGATANDSRPGTG